MHGIANQNAGSDGNLQKPRGAIGAWASAVGVLAGACVITVLALEARALRVESKELGRMKAFPFPGQMMPTVHAEDLNGNAVTVGEAGHGRTQVLIFFTTTCPYCLQNLPIWKRLSAELLADTARRHDVYWVSMSGRDSTIEYVAKHEVEAPVVILSDPKALRVMRVKAVPLTLVIDYVGRVKHVRPALLSAVSADSVTAAARDTAPPRVAGQPGKSVPLPR